MFEPARRPAQFRELIDPGFDLDLGEQPIRHATRFNRLMDRLFAVVVTSLVLGWVAFLAILLFVGAHEALALWPAW